jgi:hypothetical protein
VVAGRALVSVHLAGHLALGRCGLAERRQGRGAAPPSLARTAPRHLHHFYLFIYLKMIKIK